MPWCAVTARSAVIARRVSSWPWPLCTRGLGPRASGLGMYEPRSLGICVAVLDMSRSSRRRELAYVLDRVGSPQIKNAGTLAGNIANASPIADTLPFLYVTDARLELAGRSGTRTVPITSFYRGYKTLDLAPDEIITRIIVPLPSRSDTLRLYK